MNLPGKNSEIILNCEKKSREKCRLNFEVALKKIPNPGGGCHPSLLGVANIGALAGVSEYEVFAAIRQHIPNGKRHVSDYEIRLAVAKAFRECKGKADTDFKFPPKPQPRIKKSAFENITEKYKENADEVELYERSPIRIDWEPGKQDAFELLSQLYQPNEHLYIGDTYGQVVRQVAEWLKDRNLSDSPHIIANPMTGQQGQTKEGKASFRADECVASFAFAIAEMDSKTRSEQIIFWLAAIKHKLPVAAVIDSGGKSLHAWLAVCCKDRAEWEREVEQKLFGEYLVPLGCDRACRNEARLSRLPGHFRVDKGRWQRLLYLNPSARGGTR